MVDSISKKKEDNKKEKSIMRTKTRKRKNLPLNKMECRKQGMKIWVMLP